MNNLHGILFVLLAMVGFTLEDSFIKALSQTLHVGLVLVLLCVASAIVFAVWAKVNGDSLTTPQAWTRIPLLRASSEAVSAATYVVALSQVDLSTVAAVFQATPLVITMGAALFLGEQVGWRRWSAIVVGFIGVLLIIRPGLEGFDATTLLVLVSVLGVATRDLLTRRMDPSVPSTVVSFQAYMAVIPSGLMLMWLQPGTFAVPNLHEASMLIAGCIFGVIGYFAIVTAMRIGDAAVVTPFRYSRLLFSMLVGIAVFGERPDGVTLLGASLVIGSGLYTFLRERAILRHATVASA